MREICRFPSYQVSEDASDFDLTARAEDLLMRVWAGENIGAKRVIVVCLLAIEDHTCHPVNEIAPEPIDPRLAAKIKELCNEGHNNLRTVKALLKSYIKEICIPLPNPDSHRFYPSDKVIRNHMYLRSRMNATGDDQHSLISLVSQWRNDGAFVFARLKAREINTPTCSSDKCDIVEYGEKFLFVYQSQEQKRLLHRYGKTCFLDATYKTTLYDLPLFFVAVRTNVGYHIVCTFVCECETTSSIAEGLQVLQRNCIEWQPKYFLTDFQDSEINAIESVFPAAFVLLCDVHRNRAWDRWTRTRENVTGHSKEVMQWFMRLGQASNIPKFQATLEEFKDSPLWTDKVKNYMESIWLPHKKRWSKAYRTGLVELVASTNNGIESQHKLFKSKYLDRKCTFNLSNMLKILIDDFFPSRLKLYNDMNCRYSGRFNKYSENIPVELQRRPREFIKHAMKSLELAKSIKSCSISKQEEDVSVVVNGKTFKVRLGNDKEMPWCSCDTWYKFQMPCEHMVAALCDGDSVQWSRLSQLYLQSVYCTVDDFKKSESHLTPEQEVKPTGADFKKSESQLTPELVLSEEEVEPNMSLRTAQIQAREKIQLLHSLSYNTCDIKDLKSIEADVMKIVDKYTIKAEPPLLPLPKRAAKLKQRRRLSLNKNKKSFIKDECNPTSFPKCEGNVETVHEIWSDFTGEDIIVNEGQFEILHTDNLIPESEATLPEGFEEENNKIAYSEMVRFWEGGDMGTRYVGPYVLTSSSIEDIKTELPDEILDSFLYNLCASKGILHINSISLTAIFEGEVEVHHCLRKEVIHPKERRIVYLNTLASANIEPGHIQDIGIQWNKFLKRRKDLKLEDDVPPECWTVTTPPHSYQNDSLSCGIFVLKFAENYVNKKPLTFVWDRKDVCKVRKSLAAFLISISVKATDESTASEEHEVKLTTRTSKRKQIPKRRSSGCEYGKERSKREENDTELYCVCRKRDDGKLYWQCEMCHEWMHPSCIGLDPKEEPKHFVCDECQVKKDVPNVEVFEKDLFWISEYHTILENILQIASCDKKNARKCPTKGTMLS